MVFDEWLNGIPVAYVIIGRSQQHDMEPWMHALKDRLLLHQPGWHANAFILDNAQAEINAIRLVLCLQNPSTPIPFSLHKPCSVAPLVLCNAPSISIPIYYARLFFIFLTFCI